MFETIVGMMLTYAMTALWGIIGLIVAGLPYTRGNLRLRFWRTLSLWLIYLALTLGLVWLLLGISLYVRHGWLFVEGTVKAILPFMLAGFIPVLIVTLPLLRSVRESTPVALSKDTRIKLTRPTLLVPIYAATLASAFAAYGTIFWQPTLPSLSDTGRMTILFLLALAVTATFVIGRHKAVLQGAYTTYTAPPLWRRLLKFGLAAAMTSVLVAIIIGVNVWTAIHSSRLPEASDMMNHHRLDEGGGTPTMLSGRRMHHDHSDMVEVAALTGDVADPPDVQFELVAQKREIRLASGARVEAWTYNGEVAPELRVRQGDMVEIKLINKDIDKGVTIHWHGYNVPNAMDGVPGMTQDVVKPGDSFTYKFRAKQAGTYWFHSHQQAAEQMSRGLFGSFIVEPYHEMEVYDEDITLVNHDWNTDQGVRTAFGSQDEALTKPIESGKQIKLRIINAGRQSERYSLQGAAYKITSIDGTPIQEPEALSDQTAFILAAGGRYEVVFAMPDHPVRLKIAGDRDHDGPSVVFGKGSPPEIPNPHADSALFEPSRYGIPIVNELTAATKFDREFTMIMGNKMGFYDGKFIFLWTLNGEVYPDTPTFVVREGEKIKTTFVNKSLSEHPIHLHGHSMTVLKKNGKNVRTPWVTDTLNVNPDETYEVAFIADNPGMWMDHCHILEHAAVGMVMHLIYDNVVPSYEAGTGTGNLPE